MRKCPKLSVLQVPFRTATDLQGQLARLLILLAILAISISSTSASSYSPKGIIELENETLPRSEKEALLILPGFASKDEGVSDIRKYFSRKGFDLFIPAYLGRDSIAQCVTNLDEFIRTAKLGEYGKVHVFAYLIGGWTLNDWIRKNPENNIASIVYDRSPLQERAAYAAVQDMPFLTWLWGGKIIEEFSKTPYRPVPKDDKRIGIIIESRATELVRKHKKTILTLGEVKWDVSSRDQDCDDYFYTLNNHDEMYHNFGVVGDEILHFSRNGKFTAGAQRVKPDVDPF